MSFKTIFTARQERVNTALNQKLPSLHHEPQVLHSAMHYAVLNGGKRIRPFLVYTTGELFGASLEALDTPACAVEFIHAYSLVHDDLPAMDDDDLRRGKPTCHKAYDEATAILVGDALQSLAFKILADNHDHCNAAVQLSMLQELAIACGSLGMVGGQSLDLDATGKDLQRESLDKIHELKTGALIRASVKLGLLAADVKDVTIHQKLNQFACHIGLCFQIKDDILDIEGNTAVLGKRQGSDVEAAKATYATVQGLTFAKKRLQEEHQSAINLLDSFGTKANILRDLADYIVQRDY